VTNIGIRAFAGCTGLTEVINYATTPQQIESLYAFFNVNISDVTLRVPPEAIEAYQTAPVWRDFGRIAEIDGETSIRHRDNTNRHGILLENAIVSDVAKITIITPEPATANITILDNLGNTVFTKTTVGATALGRPQQTPIVWNLTNQSGRFVANGTYLIIAEATGISGKIYRYSTKLGVKR